MHVKDLNSLKYHELQKLAKSAGIRANQRVGKLIKALEEHYMESNAVPKAKTPTASATAKSNRSTPVASPAVRRFGTSQLFTAARKSSLQSKPANSPASAKAGKKRRRTFEMEEATLGAASTPTSDSAGEKRTTRSSSSRTNTPVENQDGPAGKRQRRNTYDKTDSLEQDVSVSPGTTTMIASIDANQSSAERKSNLLSAIDKKIQSKVAASPARQCSQASQIPRFMAYLASMKKENQQQPKPVTPGNKDWTKIHGKEFSKFDSLDVYVEKKQQRKELLLSGGAVVKRKNTKIAKPVRRAQQLAPVKPFVPSVTSVKNMSFNFTKTPSVPASKTLPAPKSSTKRSVIPPSSSKTPKFTTPSVNGPKKSIGSTARATPFVFKGANNTSMSSKCAPTSASKKNVFDLKASLARPLSWKPHTGRLQPLDINVAAVAVPKPVALVTKTKPLAARPSRQVMASKTRAASVKDVRRGQHLDRRNNQKYVEMMRRRGLMA